MPKFSVTVIFMLSSENYEQASEMSDNICDYLNIYKNHIPNAGNSTFVPVSVDEIEVIENE